MTSFPAYWLSFPHLIPSKFFLIFSFPFFFTSSSPSHFLFSFFYSTSSSPSHFPLPAISGSFSSCFRALESCPPQHLIYKQYVSLFILFSFVGSLCTVFWNIRTLQCHQILHHILFIYFEKYLYLTFQFLSISVFSLTYKNEKRN